MTNVPNALVRGFGVTPNGQPSGQDFYTPAGSGGGGVTNQEFVLAGTNHTTTSINTFVGWQSAAASAKTEFIPTSTGSLGIIVVSDLEGNSGTYALTVAPLSGSISGPNVINANNGSLTFLDTSAGWVTISQVGAATPSGNFLTDDSGNILTDDSGNPLLAS